MHQEIILIDDKNNSTNSSSNKYILKYNNGANISIEFNDKWTPDGVVCRAWYGKEEWAPSSYCCILQLIPSSGNCIWIKPLLIKNSAPDFSVPILPSLPPEVLIVTHEEDHATSIKLSKIITKNQQNGITFSIDLKNDEICAPAQEAFLLTTWLEQKEKPFARNLTCEPKGANLWVFK